MRDYIEKTKKEVMENITDILEKIKESDKKRYDQVHSLVMARAQTACEILDGIRFHLEARD